MRQKQILGSHFANAYQAERANQLVHEGKIRPVLDQVFPFEQTAQAHALMAANKHKGKMGIAVQARFAQVEKPEDAQAA
jgi:crotonyl-CoA carboxylase/reductase